jgi:GAF domain-containing protein
MTESREQKVFQALLRQVDRVIDVESLYVALYDRRTASITFPLMAHKRNGRLEKFEAPWKSHEFRPDRLFPDSVFSDGSSLLLEKGVDPWLEEKGLDYASGPRVPESLLAVPLTIRGRVAAVLVVEDESQKGAYTSDHVRILQVMANRAAGTLAALRATERLQVLNEVGQALASRTRLGVEEILEVIHEQAGRLMDARNMYVALYDTGRQTLSFPLAYYDGDPENWDSREAVIGDEPQGGLTEEVIRRRSTFSPPNVDAWYRENGIEPNVDPVPESWLGVPLISGGHILGVIAVQNDEVPNLYGAADIEILEAMANQAAAALDNARLVERLRVVNDVGQSLTSGVNLSEEEILHLIYEQASRLMNTKNMYVAFCDEAHNRLSFPLAYYEGGRQDWPSRSLLKHGVTEEVIRTLAPLNLSNYRQWYAERDLEPPVKPEESPKSWLGVPLIAEHRVLGVVALQNDEVADLYQQEDLEVLQSMAGHVATALSNTRSLRREKEKTEQLTVLQEIGIKNTSSLDLEEVLIAVAEQTLDLLDADYVTLFTYKADDDEFIRGLRSGEPYIEPTIPTKDSYAFSIVRDKSPLFVDDVRKRLDMPSVAIGETECVAFAGCPLVYRDESVGILFVNFSAEHSFSQEECDVLEMLSRQAAVAIQNARYYQLIKSELSNTEKQLDALQQIVGLNDLAGRFVHKVSNLVGTVPLASSYIEKELHRENPDLDIVLSDIKDIRTQTQQLLNMSRRIQLSTQKLTAASKSLERLEVKTVLDQALAQVQVGRSRQPLPDAIDVVKEYSDQSLYIETFTSLFTEALANLIDNALDAMPNGGVLTLGCHKSLKGNNEVVVIEIGDTGVGIPDTEKDRVYNIDYSTKESGFGYGLWLVKRICDATDTRISYRSKLDEGTTFTLVTPSFRQEDSDNE